MNPRSNHYGSSYGYLFRPRTEVGDDSHLTVVACNGFTDNCLSDSVLAVWGAKSLKKLSAVRVSVWITVREVDLIVIVLELHLEGQGVVEASALLLQLVLEVADVLAVSVPPIAVWVTLYFFL